MAVDIHPAARIGSGILLDHGTGVVIGETAVIGDQVSIMQAVTLGGTGKQTGDRHPKIGRGVLLGAGCRVLGNIPVGDGALIASVRHAAIIHCCLLLHVACLNFVLGYKVACRLRECRIS